MGQNLLLTFTSSLQIGLFGGMVLILLGWIEKKEIYTDIGRYLFLALGVFAVWVLMSGQIQVPKIIDNNIPKEIRMIALLNGIVICSGIVLLSIILKILKIKYYRITTVVIFVFALFLFFTLYNLQKG